MSSSVSLEEDYTDDEGSSDRLLITLDTMDTDPSSFNFIYASVAAQSDFRSELRRRAYFLAFLTAATICL